MPANTDYQDHHSKTFGSSYILDINKCCLVVIYLNSKHYVFKLFCYLECACLHKWEHTETWLGIT